MVLSYGVLVRNAWKAPILIPDYGQVNRLIPFLDILISLVVDLFFTHKLSNDSKNDYLRNLVDWFLGNRSAILDNLNKKLPTIRSSINKTILSFKTDSVGLKTSMNEIVSLEITIPYSELKPIPSAGYGFFGVLAGFLINTNSHL